MKEAQRAMTFYSRDAIAIGVLRGQVGRERSTLRLFLLIIDETFVSLDDLADGTRRKLINLLFRRPQTILVIKLWLRILLDLFELIDIFLIVHDIILL